MQSSLFFSVFITLVKYNLFLVWDEIIPLPIIWSEYHAINSRCLAYSVWKKILMLVDISWEVYFQLWNIGLFAHWVHHWIWWLWLIKCMIKYNQMWADITIYLEISINVHGITKLQPGAASKLVKVKLSTLFCGHAHDAPLPQTFLFLLHLGVCLEKCHL